MQAVCSSLASRSFAAPRSALSAAGLTARAPAVQRISQHRRLTVMEAAKGVVRQAAESVGLASRDENTSFDLQAGEAPSQKGKTSVITGGNSGLGFETSKSLARAGGHVIIAVRDAAKGASAAKELQAEADAAGNGGSVEYMDIELKSLKSTHDFAKKIQERKTPISILVNNAGLFSVKDEITEDGLEVLSGINHFAGWYLAQLLLPQLQAAAPARIVWVTSPSESVTPDIDFANLEGIGRHSDVSTYGLTKLYNILSMREFQRRLAGRGIETFAAQPGVARTDIFNKMETGFTRPLATALKNAGPVVGQSQAEGARPVTFAATAPTLAGKGGDINHIVGPFYSTSGPGTPEGGAFITNTGNTEERAPSNSRAYDADIAARLYDETARIVSEKVKAWDPDFQAA